MANTMERPAKKKKKALAFLSSAPKPKPAFDDFNFDNDFAADKKEEDEDEDGLDLFQRSKEYFPLVIKEQEEGSRDATPAHRDDKKHDNPEEHEAQDKDEGPKPPLSRSSKRRRLSSQTPVMESRNTDFDYDNELYGPATPPRRTSESPTSTPRKLHTERATPVSGKGKAKGKGKKSIEPEPVESDILPTPTRSNSHQPSANGVVALDDDDDDPFNDDVPSATATSARKGTTGSTPAKRVNPSPDIIDLGDSDDDLIETDSKPVEDEFAHFIKQAAEKEAAAKAAAAAAAAMPLGNESSAEEDDPSIPNAVRARRKKPGPVGPSVKIFVQSRLGDAYQTHKIFGAARGLSQDLGVVRNVYLHWLRKEGMKVSEAMEKDVFLTWKERRVYDSTSGVSLGWQPTATGEFPRSSVREPGFKGGGVLLEAWTTEEFERYTADRERQRQIDRGELVEGVLGDDEGCDDAEDQKEPSVPKIKVLLQERGKPPRGLTVWIDMAVRILARAYMRQNDVPADKEIKLMYEGDWLDPDMTVEEAEIEDMCTVDVYIK